MRTFPKLRICCAVSSLFTTLSIVLSYFDSITSHVNSNWRPHVTVDSNSQPLHFAPSLHATAVACALALSDCRFVCVLLSCHCLLRWFLPSCPAPRCGLVPSFYWISPSKACWKACLLAPCPVFLSLSSLGSGPDGQGPKPNWAFCYLMVMYSSSKPLANHLPCSQSWPRDKTSPRAHIIVLAFLAH